VDQVLNNTCLHDHSCGLLLLPRCSNKLVHVRQSHCRQVRTVWSISVVRNTEVFLGKLRFIGRLFHLALASSLFFLVERLVAKYILKHGLLHFFVYGLISTILLFDLCGLLNHVFLALNLKVI